MGTSHETGTLGSGGGKIAVEKYWRDYLFLTREIEKCLLRQDIEMVGGLLEQREKMQQMIDDCQDDDGSTATMAGQQLLKDVADKNRGITQIIHMLRNRSQKNHAAANAYDRLGMSNTGFRMDSKS